MKTFKLFIWALIATVLFQPIVFLIGAFSDWLGGNLP